MTQIIGCNVAGTTAFSQGRISDAEYSAVLTAGQRLDKVFVYSLAGSGTGTFDFAIYDSGFSTKELSPRRIYKTAVSFTVPASSGWVEISGFSDDMSAFEGQRLTATLSNPVGFSAQGVSGALASSTNGQRNNSSTVLADPFGSGLTPVATSDQNAFYVQTVAGGADYTQRKGSTFDVTYTLGTITTATLNAVNVFDHVSSQAAGTVSFTGAITDEITTSGVVDLVLGDGATTETYTVQVNVYGVVPSNNPAQKDGAALASLTGVQIRITGGANLDGTQVYYSGTETTDASGNFATLDVSTSAAAAADPVLMTVLTSAGNSITSTETVELI